MDDMFVTPKKPLRSGLRPSARPIQTQQASQVVAPTQPLPQPSQQPQAYQEPAFRPPDVVAKQEEKQEQQQTPAKPPKKASWWRRMSKKKKIIVAAIVVVLLAGGGTTAAIVLNKDTPAPAVQEQPEEEAKVEEAPKPTTVASTLTGVQVDPALNKRGVTGIMIENSLDARPQSGLLEAGIVYEAIAEGGITRFLALFQEAQPSYIGPVRSARPYYVEWLAPYGATYAHAGGSPEAISLISTLGIKDMDHGANGSSYTRVDSRFAPHNLYTSMTNLDAIRTKKGWENTTFTGFSRKAEEPGKTLTATKVNFNVSGPNFAVSYDYDATANAYKRNLAGKPHTDEKSGKQLEPKVVVAMVVPYSIHPDGVHSKYQTIGSGQAYIFQDGIYQEAYWSKASQTAALEFKDAGGRTIPLNPGQTWLTAVGVASMVTYSGPPPGATP